LDGKVVQPENERLIFPAQDVFSRFWNDGSFEIGWISENRLPLKSFESLELKDLRLQFEENLTRRQAEALVEAPGSYWDKQKTQRRLFKSFIPNLSSKAQGDFI
jgi:hypothetical protein